MVKVDGKRKRGSNNFVDCDFNGNGSDTNSNSGKGSNGKGCRVEKRRK